MSDSYRICACGLAGTKACEKCRNKENKSFAIGSWTISDKTEYIRRKERGMNNAEKFQEVFGYYATEMWAKPESEFLEWINSEYIPTIEEDCISRERTIERIKRNFYGDNQWVADEVERLLLNAPSVVPQKHESGYNDSEISENNAVRPTEDCISRAEVLSIISDCQDINDKAKYNTLAEVFNKVLEAPSVVPKRAEGEWHNPIGGMYVCSTCKSSFTNIPKDGHWKPMWYYCPNCGAKMRGAEE